MRYRSVSPMKESGNTCRLEPLLQKARPGNLSAMLRTLVGLSCGVSLLLAASVSRAQCTKDTDCKGDRVCDAGNCVTPPQTLPPPPAAPSGADASGAGTPASGGDPGQALAAQVPPAAEPEIPPEEPRRERPKQRRHSTGMMVGGIVMVSFVPVALIAAAVANNKQNACETGGVSFNFDDEGIQTYDGVDCSTYDKTIYGGLISAVVLAGVGIPLIVIGGKKEPAAATATITPWATPRAAGLGLRVDM